MALKNRRTISTLSCDIAYPRSPAASRASSRLHRLCNSMKRPSFTRMAVAMQRFPRSHGQADTGRHAPSRRRPEMMSEDAKFALGF